MRVQPAAAFLRWLPQGHRNDAPQVSCTSQRDPVSLRLQAQPFAALLRWHSPSTA
ncbi:hypothetical protein ppKF707_0303 [Metapseudomonas furukawaii]|nr:hypothetical protein ppKF707_0303 [Pseudomonas furukawaii]